MANTTSSNSIANEDTKAKNGHLKQSTSSGHVSKTASHGKQTHDGHLGPVQEGDSKSSSDGRRRGSIMGYRAADIEVIISFDLKSNSLCCY